MTGIYYHSAQHRTRSPCLCRVGKKKSHLKQLSMMVEYTGLHVKSGPSASCPLAFYWLWTKVASCSHDSSWTGLIITFRQRWICDHIKTAQYKSNILKLNLTLNCSPGSTEQTLFLFIYLFLQMRRVGDRECPVHHGSSPSSLGCACSLLTHLYCFTRWTTSTSSWHS